jgi:hypothetical protein
LAAGGLEDLVYGLIDGAIRDIGLPTILVDPEHSTVLGGDVTLATWGDAEDPLNQIALYVRARDADSAYQTLGTVVFGALDGDATEGEIVGGGKAMYSPETDAVVLQYDDIVIVSTGVAAQAIMQLRSGSLPSLAAFEPFTDLQPTLEDEGIVRAYLNGPLINSNLASLLMDALGVSFAELGLLLSVSQPFVAAQTALGLTAVEDGFLLRMAQRPLDKAAFSFGTSDSNMAERISAEAGFFASGSDLGENPLLTQLVRTVAQAFLLQQEPETFDPMADPIAVLEELSGIDLQVQLLDQLSGDYVVAAAARSFDSPENLSALVLTEVENPAAIDGLLRLARLGLAAGLIEEQPGMSWKAVDVEGGSLIVFTFDAGVLVPIEVSIGLVNDELIIAYGDGYETLLAGDDQASLADLEPFGDAIDVLPESDGSLLWLDLQQVITTSGLTALEPLNIDELDMEPALAPLTNLQALVSSTYDQNEITVTDVALVIASSTSGPAGDVPETRDLTVESVEILDKGESQILSVSPTGEYLLVRNDGRTCVLPIQVMTPDDKLCTPEMPQVDRDRIAWSPNGQAVAFTEDALRLLYDSDIWTISLETGITTNQTDDGFEGGLFEDGDTDSLTGVFVDLNPAWSPDGNSLAFARSDGPRELGTDLMILNLDSGELDGPFKLSADTFAAWAGMQWTEDDTVFVGMAGLQPDAPENGIYEVDLGTGQIDRVLAGSGELQGVVSLVEAIDENRLLVGYPQVLSRFVFDDECPLAILDLRSGEATTLRIDGQCVISAGVSPDGSQLIGSAFAGAPLAFGTVDQGSWEIADDAPFRATGLDWETLIGSNTVVGIPAIVWASDDSAWFSFGSGTIVRAQLIDASAPD